MASEVYQAIAESLLTEVADPRLKHARLARVVMTADLGIARLYFYLIEGNTPKNIQAADKALRRAAGFLKRIMNNTVQMKFTPDIEIYFEDIP
ncbi:MAG: ribosome-binding factor A [Deltaproteobacteria bacterium]|nr:ribosome-binding factor A [Deltaproteobacteria bacterium]